MSSFVDLKNPLLLPLLLMVWLSLDSGEFTDYYHGSEPAPGKAEACPGASLLQASSAIGELKGAAFTEDAYNLAEEARSFAATETGELDQGFREYFGEFCLLFLVLICLGCGCARCFGRVKSSEDVETIQGLSEVLSGAAGDSADVKTKQEGDRAGAKASSHDDPAKASSKRKLVKKETSLHLFAGKEDSDAGDWQIPAESDDELPIEYDPEVIPKFIEKHFSSWKLLTRIMCALAEFWGALGIMYWSLLTRSDELLDCEAYVASVPECGNECIFINHACHYTHACLSGFPILAANMAVVLMIRNLLQTRLYYSMLRHGVLVVFHGVPVLRTWVPWVIFLSMLQGGLHFGLKGWVEPEHLEWTILPRMIRKFVLPGTIFFSMLFRYADVENVLVPLNHLAELEVTQKQRYSPWLGKISMVNERVLAFEARHRDVFLDTMTSIGRMPAIHDLVKNIVDNYEESAEVWHSMKNKHWGIFKSMWPAGLLLDSRLDKHDEETRTWFIVSTILLTGSAGVTVLSVYVFLRLTSPDSWHLFYRNVSAIFTTETVENTAMTLGNTVTLVHAVIIIVLLFNSVRNMFYYELEQGRVAAAFDQSLSGDLSGAVRQFDHGGPAVRS